MGWPIKANFKRLPHVIFCDVLAGMAKHEYPAELPAASALLETIVSLEQQLLDSQLRHRPEDLERLLHPQFHEVGASGRSYSRQAIIEQLAGEAPHDPGHFHVAAASGLQLAGDLVLLRWQLPGDVPTRRSSLWIRADGAWQMIFHQGTAACVPESGVALPPPVAPDAGADPEEHGVRPLELADAPAVYEAFASNPDMRRQGEARTPQQALAYVQALLAADSRQRPWAITHRDRLVGLVCATVDAANANAWVWYWMHQDYRGQSLATRALAALARHLFEDLGMFRLELGVRANNPASQHVAESNGFLREGVERAKFRIDGQRVDVYTYARLRTDPASAVRPLGVRVVR